MPDGQVTIVRWYYVAVLIVTLAVVLLLIAGVLAAMYYAAQWMGLQAAIAWAAFVVLLLLLLRIEHERKRQQQRLLADRKREQYFELLTVLQKCFFSHDPVQAALKNRLELQKWSLRIALLGSDEVVRAWRRFYDLAMGEFKDEEDDGDDEDVEDDEEDEDQEDEDEDDDADDDPLFAAQTALVHAMRRDCGHTHSRLMRWEIAHLLQVNMD